MMDIDRWTDSGRAPGRARRVARSLALLLLAAFISPFTHAEEETVIVDKTLVAWVTPGDLEQRGGSVLTIEKPGGVFDGASVRSEAKVARWRRRYLDVGLVVQGVGGEAHKGGSGGRGLGLVEGTTHDGGDLPRVCHLGGPLGERPNHVRKGGPPSCQLTDVQVAGGQHDGRPALVGVVKQADAVGKAGLNVEVDK